MNYKCLHMRSQLKPSTFVVQGQPLRIARPRLLMGLLEPLLELLEPLPEFPAAAWHIVRVILCEVRTDTMFQRSLCGRHVGIVPVNRIEDRRLRDARGRAHNL